MSVVANVALNIDSRGATQSLRAVQQGARATDNAVSGLLKTVGKLAIVLGAIEAVQFVFAQTAELESQTRSLEVLTGSAIKTKQIIQELQQLGAVTPFTSSELIDAAKRLQAFGVEGDKVVETTRRLADVSGATGAELQGLVTAYGQVQAKGRLQGEELLQFQERGIALQGELQKMYGLSGQELQKALSKGQISAKAVEVAIIRLTDVGGKYANGALAQSDTLKGRFSTLMDSVEMLAKKIGQILEPAFKAVLNIAIGIVDQINKALAGPDYKVANNQLFNTRAEISKLKKEIDAAQKAGISPTTRSAPVLGVDGQVVAGGGMVLPEMQAELKQLEQQAIRLDNRLKELRNQSKAKPVTTTPAVPALLPEKPKAAKPMSMDSLLNSKVSDALQLDIARQETMKQKDLSGAQGTENEAQAKRMIEYAHQYRKALLETKALTIQIGIIDKQRSAIIASFPKDKRGEVAIDIDRRKADLLNQINLITQSTNTIAEEHYGKALEAQRADELILKKKLEDETLLGQQRKQSLTDELALAQARLAGNEAEIILKQQIRDIMAGTAGLSQQDVTNTLNQINATKQLLTEKEKIKNLVQNIGASIESGIVGAIDGAITGAKSLQESLADILNDIGKMLISFGVKTLLSSISPTIDGTKVFGGPRAAGGPVSGNSTYMVGEKGPELFVPSAAGTIIPAGPTAGIRDAMANGSNGNGATAPVLNMSFETTRFGNTDYVSREQLEAAMMQTRAEATKAGARRGMTMTLDKLQQSPSTRSRVGLG